MPSSRPNTIPTIIHLLQQLKPRSILDVGIGFGKWGHLFREYTDILEAEKDPRRYERQHWQVRIDGIEGYAPYVTDMHRYLYNQVHLGDATEVIKGLPHYDLIFLGDVIEHFDKETGLQLLREAVARADKAVIVSTPKYDTGQEDLCGNELERHRSLWAAGDFREFAGAKVKTIDRATLLAVIVKPGIAPPHCTPPRPVRPGDVRRLRQMKAELGRLVPETEPFILVDQEQFRAALPHRRALPFLEKEGQYWGPPPDAETAIRELERLRQAGARYLALAWPAFWWVDYYPGFYQHLRDRFRCVSETDALILFDLRAEAQRGSAGD